MRNSILTTVFAMGFAMLAGSAGADNNLIKSAYAPPANSPQTRQAAISPGAATSASNVFVFSAPPRESLEDGIAQYGPIADFLTKVTGRKFEYRQPDNWLTYQTNLQQDEYDLVFDGPHFVSWRMEHRKHEPLVKIPGDFIFVFLAKKDNDRVSTLADLAGRPVCGHPAPNQGTLRLYSMFDNPARQPQLRAVKGWRNIYKEMIAGNCVGGIVPLKIYKQLDPSGAQAKVLHVTTPAPGQAFTASTRIPYDMRQQIKAALLSEDGQKATAALRKRFPTVAYVEAKPEEYQGVSHLLNGVWGFDK